MAWGKIDDALFGHPKMAIAGLEAVGLWVKCFAWSCSYGTDGLIPDEIIQQLAGGEEPAKRLTDRLVSCRLYPDGVGLWEPEPGGQRMHDFLARNPSAAEIAAKRAKRAAAGRLGGIRSGQRRRNRSGTVASAASDPRTEQMPTMLPEQVAPEASLVDEAPPAAEPAAHADEQIADEEPPPESAVARQASVPLVAARPAVIVPLDDARPPPRDGKRAGAKRSAPLPFRIDAALAAIAEASGGRFVASELATGPAIAAQRHIRAHPDLALWRLVGEWFAAGGEAWKQTLDSRHLGDFPAWIAHATKWRDAGRPPIARGAATVRPRGDCGLSTSINEESRAHLRSLWK